MDFSLWDFFTDPVLRAPTIGCMLMCVSAALTGVIVFLRKQSLVGEALSHASYPGVVLGLLTITWIDSVSAKEWNISMGILIGAFSTAFVGYWLIYFLQRVMRVPTDAALTLVLSVLFGAGITLASRVQFTHPALYRQIQVYLYGQAATMTDIHIFIYSLLCAALILVLLLFYKEIKAISMDHLYAKSLGIPASLIDGITIFLTALALVVGIRSVGVVLMSAMFIAPAVAARQFTDKLSHLFLLASACGLASGFIGNYLSVAGSNFLSKGVGFSLPTGPMIVITASILCLLALLFSPQRGIILRQWRAFRFRKKSLSENILKMLWRSHPQPEALRRIVYSQGISNSLAKQLLHKLIKSGLVESSQNVYALTAEGFKKAAHIVRLHRLWEVYLVDYLSVGSEKVHRSAEEMEHIITPEIEEKLIHLLNDPKQDPHHQPIPPRNKG